MGTRLSRAMTFAGVMAAACTVGSTCLQAAQISVKSNPVPSGTIDSGTFDASDWVTVDPFAADPLTSGEQFFTHSTEGPISVEQVSMANTASSLYIRFTLNTSFAFNGSNFYMFIDWDQDTSTGVLLGTPGSVGYDYILVGSGIVDENWNLQTNVNGGWLQWAQTGPDIVLRLPRNDLPATTGFNWVMQIGDSTSNADWYPNLWWEDYNTYEFGAVPEPASLALIALGSAAFVRRRSH